MDSRRADVKGLRENIFLTVFSRDFHVFVQDLVPMNTPKVIETVCETAMTWKDDKTKTGFEKFATAYENDLAVMYRGVAGSHFSWEQVRNGEMKSPGNEDVPDFTMGGSSTCWLPTALTEEEAINNSVNSVDQFTLALSEIADIPIGISLKIPVGRSKKIGIAWFNVGEVALRGPLRAQQFSIHQICWLKKGAQGLPYATTWPADLGLAKLPPLRPYLDKAKKESLETWWAECEKWVQTLDKVGHVAHTKKDDSDERKTG